MKYVIIVLALVVALIAFMVMWLVSSQRTLVKLDENINNALSQIGVQLSSRFDALTALLDLTKGYMAYESKTLADTVAARRAKITSKSTAGDVQKQENVITEALGQVFAVAEAYPELKANQSFIQCMDSVNSYENMVRTGRLIYNDSVTKLNRAIRMFPTSLIAGSMGIMQREYLEEEEGKETMPNITWR